MALLFEPEPIDQLQARYLDALEKEWQIGIMGQQRPGQLRSNVFDTENGIRLIVSKEYNKEGDKFIHLSASFDDSIFKFPKHQAQKFFFEKVVEAFEDICFTDIRLSIYPTSISDGGIPHWLITLPKTSD